MIRSVRSHGWGALLVTVVIVALVLVVAPTVGPPGPTNPRAAAAATPEAADPPERQPEAVYVDAVHELFLDRPATADELRRWVPTIELGARHALTSSLAVSDEWAGTRVEELYQRILRRQAEQGGRAYWTTTIADGQTLEAVAADLYGSDEYYQRAGESPDAFVVGLYRDLLRREADSDGQGYWADRVELGAERAAVATGFYGSVESRRSRVEGTYREILRRPPDADGRDFWVDTVATIGDVSLAAELAASAEFYERVTGAVAADPPERGAGTGFQPYAMGGDVTFWHPTALLETIGLHQSGQDGGIDQLPVIGAVHPVLLPSRGRGTGRRTAADIVVPPDTEIRSPVSGTVLEARTYVLYCKYSDDQLVIEPDEHPGWRVVVLHIDGVMPRAGDRVEGGITPIAPRATVLPFTSQVERYGGDPPWPHVHVEMYDPTVPDRPPNGC